MDHIFPTSSIAFNAAPFPSFKLYLDVITFHHRSPCSGFYYTWNLCDGLLSDIVIVGAARTPLGAFQGAFASVPASQLGAHAIKGQHLTSSLPPFLTLESSVICV